LLHRHGGAVGRRVGRPGGPLRPRGGGGARRRLRGQGGPGV